jgi:nuclear pore complex protein Nup188
LRKFYLLIHCAALEGHAFLKASSNSLKQMITCIYPGLL